MLFAFTLIVAILMSGVINIQRGMSIFSKYFLICAYISDNRKFIQNFNFILQSNLLNNNDNNNYRMLQKLKSYQLLKALSFSFSRKDV